MDCVSFVAPILGGAGVLRVQIFVAFVARIFVAFVSFVAQIFVRFVVFVAPLAARRRFQIG